MFVSPSLHYLAMPISKHPLAPLVKVALANTQSRWRCAPVVISRGHYLAREPWGANPLMDQRFHRFKDSILFEAFSLQADAASVVGTVDDGVCHGK